MKTFKPLKECRQVEFNPHNAEHMMAFIELNYGTAKQYKNFRFEFDESKYDNALTFMKECVIRTFIEDVSKDQCCNVLIDRVVEKENENLNKSLVQKSSLQLQNPGIKYPL